MFSGTPVILAPQAGITDFPFRKIVQKFGASAVVYEMASSEALIRNHVRTLKRYTSIKNTCLNIAQIVGSDPEKMAQSAIISQDLGADAIDINMGCPAKKIVQNNSGAALLKNKYLAIKIAESVLNAVKIPVTIKMRLGWDANSINANELAIDFQNLGISSIAVHGRTRNQFYSGQADWQKIGEIKKNINKIPLICNGDIIDYDTAQNALKTSKADGIMIGRAAVGAPWLLNDIMNFLHNGILNNQPSIDQKFSTILEHFELSLDFYGIENGIKIFRKHLCAYTSGMKNSANFRQQINTIDSVDEIKKMLKSFHSFQINSNI